MTDFRLLRRGGFYHAVARYGEQVWTPFTYAGIHATERVLRRKEQHRFWGVDCYSQRGGTLPANRQPAPSTRTRTRRWSHRPRWWWPVDAWARELARSTLSEQPPPPCSAPRTASAARAVVLRPSRDLVSDPSGHPVVGRPERAGHLAPPEPRSWRPSTAGLAQRLVPRPSAQFPAMRASWLAEVVPGVRSGEVLPPTADGSARPGWWRCSTGGTTCPRWA